MKKVMIVVTMVVLWVLSFVYADMSAPEVKPYKAYVSNFEGAQYFDYQTQEYHKVDYGTKIYVIYEDYYSSDNIVYVTAQIGEERENNNSPYVQLKLSDISILDGSSVIPDDFANMKGKKAIYKTKGNGAEMKKGPAEVYESSGVVIPNNAEVVVYNYSFYEAWNYVDYKGTKGWIRLSDGGIYFKPEYQEITILDNTRMEPLNGNDDTHRVVIPANTKITDYLFNNQRYYFTYDGQEGYLYSEKVVVAEQGSIEVSEDNLKIFRSMDVIEDPEKGYWDYPVLAEQVPQGTILKYDYRNPDQPLYYVEYSGEHGWAFAYQSKVTVEKGAALKDAKSEPTQENTPIPAITESKDMTASSVSKGTQVLWMVIALIVVVTLTVIVTVTIIKKKD